MSSKESLDQSVLAVLRPAGTVDGITVNGIRFEWRVPNTEQYLKVMNEHAFSNPIRQDLALYASMLTGPKELAAMKHPAVSPRKGKPGKFENDDLIEFLANSDAMLLTTAVFPAMKKSLGAMREFDIPDEDLKRFFPAAYGLRASVKLALKGRTPDGPADVESGTAEGLGSDSPNVDPAGKEGGDGDNGGGKVSP